MEQVKPSFTMMRDTAHIHQVSLWIYAPNVYYTEPANFFRFRKSFEDMMIFI